MNVLIIKVDYFDPEKWPVLGAPYKVNPEGSRSSITEVAHTATSSGIILLVGSQSPRTKHSLKIKLLGAVQCHMALFETRKVVAPELVNSPHFTRRDGAFRMPYCIPYSKIWNCRRPLSRASSACGNELVDPNDRRKWLIQLSDHQAQRALEILEQETTNTKDLPLPAHGFIQKLD